MYKLKKNKGYLFYSKNNYKKIIKNYFKIIRTYLIINNIKNKNNIKNNKYLKIKSYFRSRKKNNLSIIISKKTINHIDSLLKLDLVYLQKINNLVYKIKLLQSKRYNKSAKHSLSHQVLADKLKNNSIFANKINNILPKKNNHNQNITISGKIFSFSTARTNSKNTIKNKSGFVWDLPRTRPNPIFRFTQTLQDKQFSPLFNQKHRTLLQLPLVSERHSLTYLLKIVRSKFIFTLSRYTWKIKKLNQSLSKIKLQDNSLRYRPYLEDRYREKYLRVNLGKIFAVQIHNNNNKLHSKDKNIKYDSIQIIEKFIKNHTSRKEVEKINALIHHTYSKQIENNEIINKKIDQLKQNIESILKINNKNYYPCYHKIKNIHLEDFI